MEDFHFNLSNMTPVVLEVPPGVQEAIRIPEKELTDRLLLELAVNLYAQELLPLVKSAELAKLNRYAFCEVLAKRGIHRHYGPEELEEDLAYASRQ